MYLDLGLFRVVHACWDPNHIEWLDQNYHSITPELLSMATDKRSGNPAEETLKGKEYDLPEGVTMTAGQNHIRQECRGSIPNSRIVSGVC